MQPPGGIDRSYLPPTVPILIPELGGCLSRPGWATDLGAGGFGLGQPAEEFIHTSADDRGIVRAVAVSRPWSPVELHRLALFTLLNALFLPARVDRVAHVYRPDRTMLGPDSRDAARYDDALVEDHWREATWRVDEQLARARVWSCGGLAAGYACAPATPGTSSSTPNAGSPLTVHVVARDVDVTDVTWVRVRPGHGFPFDPFRPHPLADAQRGPRLGLPFLSDEALDRYRETEV